MSHVIFMYMNLYEITAIIIFYLFGDQVCVIGFALIGCLMKEITTNTMDSK